mmetsp:Transcript_29235/g.51139  ORF Transcript_29235/g.51139 Transcript_29235/m.51139 type:complete len:103 (+) Transcript_29235:3-311(+)
MLLCIRCTCKVCSDSELPGAEHGQNQQPPDAGEPRGEDWAESCHLAEAESPVNGTMRGLHTRSTLLACTLLFLVSAVAAAQHFHQLEVQGLRLFNCFVARNL